MSIELPTPLSGRRQWLAHALSLPWLPSGLSLPWVAHGLSLSNPASAQTRRSPTPLVFPRDHGAHPETRIEWWYITGELRAQGELYGFQITFFRVRTGQSDDAGTSRLAAPQLLFAHAALTDVQAGKLEHAERLARWNGLADPEAAQGASLTDTDVRIGRWQLRHDRGRYLARWGDTAAGFDLDLEMRTTQPLLLQGLQGLSAKSPKPEHYSHYYSQPHLSVQGTLQHRGRRLAVQGRAWLDHEWSQALLDPQAVGWDWVGLNLDDGSALTAFRLRREDGSVLHAGGSLRRPGQPVRNFAAAEVSMTPGRLWRSPSTGARYPVEWVLQTPAGRHSVRAVLDAQELDNRASTGTVYWEGLSRVHDADSAEGRKPIGSGYLEMTGYAGRLQF